MILAWVISLLLLCSSLIAYLERLTSLRVLEAKVIEQAQERFIFAEKSVLECEKNIINISTLSENNCFMQSAGKGLWLISSKEKPSIHIHILVDEKSGAVTRLNWRQAFE
ncbi:hypothetical protein [Polynucleobacter sp. MWH-UH2A]|uniref:hypothetical protein n=1 Tax=Polynucleobacter sp. MWH-UH2A TaxID=1855617 RepID=UPI001BFDA654|nr:hypothetical protein [Polynucleobacter sp. MWH-UH2A]QWD64319.1 hypothetical protein IC571_01425 [Polynucleobacter sp. MWH-UH2A]